MSLLPSSPILLRRKAAPPDLSYGRRFWRKNGVHLRQRLMPVFIGSKIRKKSSDAVPLFQPVLATPMNLDTRSGSVPAGHTQAVTSHEADPGTGHTVGHDIDH